MQIADIVDVSLALVNMHNPCGLLCICFGAKCKAVQASKLQKRGEKLSIKISEALSFSPECSLVLKL